MTSTPPNAHLPSFRGSRKHSPSLFSCFPCSVSPIYVLLFSPFYSSCHKKTHNHTAEQANWMFVEILIAGYCRPKIWKCALYVVSRPNTSIYPYACSVLVLDDLQGCLNVWIKWPRNQRSWPFFRKNTPYVTQQILYGCNSQITGFTVTHMGLFYKTISPFPWPFKVIAHPLETGFATLQNFSLGVLHSVLQGKGNLWLTSTGDLPVKCLRKRLLSGSALGSLILNTAVGYWASVCRAAVVKACVCSLRTQCLMKRKLFCKQISFSLLQPVTWERVEPLRNKRP